MLQCLIRHWINKQGKVMWTFDPNPISTSPSQCFQRVPTALIEKLRADSIGFVAKPWCPAGSNNLITTTLRQSIRICCKVIHITTKFLYFSTFDVCFKCSNDVLNIRIDKSRFWLRSLGPRAPPALKWPVNRSLLYSPHGCPRTTLQNLGH